MSIQAKLHFEDQIINVLELDFGFKQASDYTGRPVSKTRFTGLYMLIEASKETDIWEWMINPNLAKQLKVQFIPRILGGKTRIVEFIDAHCIKYKENFSSTNTTSATIALHISAAAIKDHNTGTEFEEHWRTTYPTKAPLIEKEDKKEVTPKIVKGWWTYDKKGDQPYYYKMLDENSKREKIAVELGETVYFHVEVKDIEVGSEIQLQLFDYDDFFGFDNLNMDTSRFPIDPIHKTGIVEIVDDKTITTIPLLLDEKWEAVIGDDHNDFGGSRDQNIELYWKVTYNELEKNLPYEQDNYLRVTYAERDFFIEPAVEGASVPEFYDKWGKLIIFGFKRAKDIASKAYDANKSGALAISDFVSYKIRISTETTAISGINAIKKKIYKETINLDTNMSTKIGYEIEEASSFVIKDSFKYVDVQTKSGQIKKKFSDYFNKRDIHKGTVIGLKEGREILRFLDYVSVTKTLLNMFPKEGSAELEVPKPSSAASIITTFTMGELSWALSGSLSALFFVADVVATEVVKEMMKGINETAQAMLTKAKLGGLSKLRAFLDTSRLGEESFGGYVIIDDVPQSTYEKLMCGEIKTIEKFKEDIRIGYGDYYSFLVQESTNSNSEKDIMILDSVYKQ